MYSLLLGLWRILKPRTLELSNWWHPMNLPCFRLHESSILTYFQSSYLTRLSKGRLSSCSGIPRTLPYLYTTFYRKKDTQAMVLRYLGTVLLNNRWQTVVSRYIKNLKITLLNLSDLHKLHKAKYYQMNRQLSSPNDAYMNLNRKYELCCCLSQSDYLKTGELSVKTEFMKVY